MYIKLSGSPGFETSPDSGYFAEAGVNLKLSGRVSKSDRVEVPCRSRTGFLHCIRERFSGEIWLGFWLELNV